MRLLPILVPALAAAWLAACGPQPAAPPTERPEPLPAASPDEGDEAAARLVCDAYCQRLRKCGGSECQCPAEGRKVRLLRRSYLGQLTLCLDGAACSAIDAGQAWAACHETVIAMLEPEDALRDFCFASSRRAARCGRGDDADQSACLIAFRHISGAALERASTCLERPCPEVPGCVARWLRP